MRGINTLINLYITAAIIEWIMANDQIKQINKSII